MALTLPEIDSLTRAFADAHAELADLVAQMNDEIERAKRKRLPEIKRLVARASEKHNALKAGIESSEDLFVKPRTYVLHGIKLGFKKGKGGIQFSDADRVVELVHKYYDSDRAALLLRTFEEPDKDALAKLTAAELKKLGCEIADAGDQVVIKPTDSEVDKIVNALLKDAMEDTAQAA